jgi:serine/threonine-protein kinase RsbT
MHVRRRDVLPVKAQTDIVLVRQRVRALTSELGFRLINQTKLVTAASELARNTLEYGGGGDCEVEIIEGAAAKVGLRLSFADQGPGIADLAQAMTDGYTSGHGLGMGLSGSKRLVDEFEIWSKVGEGTRVTVTGWR